MPEAVPLAEGAAGSADSWRARRAPLRPLNVAAYLEALCRLHTKKKGERQGGKGEEACENGLARRLSARRPQKV